MTKKEEELKRLRRENEFMLRMLVDIEERSDRGTIDLQQVAVGIKRLRDLLGTQKIIDGVLKPGLVRE